MGRCPAKIVWASPYRSACASTATSRLALIFCTGLRKPQLDRQVLPPP
ncbi:hypothetical protein CISG_08277 [Coccidioides immitis RMSCC 3703]|uniref:Uncharacterized protein n=1 Tax=Coccidioides immitis RMSCC 3703 TaxID=454286 RepID=A0A0J8R4Y6_COCIT|nr:hypothetical protein CISG_08277 [Coccidioides immitis RMSCC 3703]